MVGGELERMLDLPAENLMSAPIETTTEDEQLDVAVGSMLENEISSVVVLAGEDSVGLVTKTDVLQALSLTGRKRMPIQITTIELLDELSRADDSEMVESIASKYRDLSVLEADVYLDQHHETLRGPHSSWLRSGCSPIRDISAGPARGMGLDRHSGSPRTSWSASSSRGRITPGARNTRHRRSSASSMDGG